MPVIVWLESSMAQCYGYEVMVCDLLVDRYFIVTDYSNNPNTTGNNCFFLETTPGASRVPSASGG